MFDGDVPVVIAGPAAAPDVALVSLRHRHGRADAAAELARLRGTYDGPLLVEPFAERDLPGIVAAISAGAGGLILGADAGARLVADVRAKAAMLAPLIRDEPADTIPGARAAIDRIDAALATLLERRAELAGRVQRLKPVGGYAGRDPAREREIVEAMAGRAPRLGADRLARIMNAVIEAGLDASEEHDLSPA